MLAALLTKKKALREERLENDHGFTLIELLVVVVIIGILIAIAIPLYSNYKKGAENKSAASDVRNAIPVVEQYYTDIQPNAYPANVAVAATQMTFDASHKANVSTGNSIGYTNVAASGTTPAGYKICAWNSDGQTLYTYNSTTGATTSAANTATAPAAC